MDLHLDSGYATILTGENTGENAMLTTALFRACVTLSFSLALTACATQHAIAPVEVDRVVYVPISNALTEPCPVAMPRNATVGEALRIARERRQALESCNAKLDQIRSVQGTPKR